MRSFVLATAVIWALTAGSANAATPCDFKGLAVGDHASPRQIMKTFGIEMYKDKTVVNTNQTREELDSRMKRANKVGLMNELEEEEFREGPSCSLNSCTIPYGVQVGNETSPIQVNLFVVFDQTAKITTIDVKYGRIDWDDVRELMNTKYGDSWAEEQFEDVFTDFETKNHHLETVTQLTHRPNGINSKTGDACSITAVSRDVIFLHTTPPQLRSILEINLVSKNF